MKSEVRRLGREDGVVVSAAQLKGDFAGDGFGDPALGGFTQHDGLRIEPAALVEQAAELAAIVPVLLDRVLVVNAGDEALVGDEEQGEAGRLVNAAALGLDDPVLNLIGHAQAMAATDAIGFKKKFDGVGELAAVEGDGKALFKADGDLFALDFDIVAPEGRAHDGNDDLDGSRKLLQVFCFVGCAEQVGVGGVGLLGGHLVGEAGALHVRGHLRAAAELVNESRVEPWLVDLEAGIDEQAVAVEALDIVAFKSGAVAPDLDVVLLHCGHQQGAGNGAADGSGVEVGHAGGGDVEGAGLERGDAFANQRAAAVDEAGLFGAVFESRARNSVVVGFVGLAQVSCVGVGNCALLLHPVQGGRGVEPAGEGNADFLPRGQRFENCGHACEPQRTSSFDVLKGHDFSRAVRRAK